MLDLVVIDGKARGIIVRNLVTGEMERHSADAVVLASGGYGRVYFLSTNAWNSNGSAAWRCHRRGARSWPTPATCRSTRPASPSAASSSPSSR